MIERSQGRNGWQVYDARADRTCILTSDLMDEDEPEHEPCRQSFGSYSYSHTHQNTRSIQTYDRTSDRNRRADNSYPEIR